MPRSTGPLGHAFEDPFALRRPPAEHYCPVDLLEPARVLGLADSN